MIHQEQDSKILFEEFLQEKTFLSNLAPKTLSFYRQSFKAFALTFPLTQNQLNSTVVRLREQGMSANCVNSYIRGINPFLSWMFENKHLAQILKVKKLKCEEKQMRTFSDAQIRTISYRQFCPNSIGFNRSCLPCFERLVSVMYPETARFLPNSFNEYPTCDSSVGVTLIPSLHTTAKPMSALISLTNLNPHAPSP